MLRKTLTYSLALTMLVTTVGCGGAVLNESNPQPEASPAATGETRKSQNRLSDGQYGVQQATYNDGTGEYSVVLLDTKPGESSVFRANNLRMARLTEEEVKAGKKSYFKVENGQPSLHLTEDFKIEYVHNVTETQVNPETQQRETVVVRQESSFWTPFAGALAGQALGSLLFTPQYYVPPVYSRGGLSGFGGYGSSYDQAVSRYQTRYNAPPAEVRNRQVFRSTGQLRTPTSSSNRPKASQSDRSSGSGFGSSTLRRDNNNNTNRNYRPNRGFGSGFGSRSRGFRRR